MDFFPNKEANEKLARWIHQNYGKQAGITIDDYYLHIDENLCDGKGNPIDVAIYAGGVIHIWIRYSPLQPEQFKACLAGVFIETRLRQFLRSRSLVRQRDALRWYALERKFVDLPPISKKTKISNVVTEVITMVRVRDVKTKREEMVAVVNGNSFDAQAEALRRLYGDKFNT